MWSSSLNTLISSADYMAHLSFDPLRQGSVSGLSISQGVSGRRCLCVVSISSYSLLVISLFVDRIQELNPLTVLLWKDKTRHVFNCTKQPISVKRDVSPAAVNRSLHRISQVTSPSSLRPQDKSSPGLQGSGKCAARY